MLLAPVDQLAPAADADPTAQEMASESVRALNEKIASDNLFKAKAVGEVQVSHCHHTLDHELELMTLARPRPTRSSAAVVSRESVHITRCRRGARMSQ